MTKSCLRINLYTARSPYPEQTFPEIAPYPWTVRGDGELCQVTDLVITNPYQALDFGTHWNELHTVRNVFACPLKTGVYIQKPAILLDKGLAAANITGCLFRACQDIDNRAGIEAQIGYNSWG